MEDKKAPDPQVIAWMREVMADLGITTAGQLVNLLVKEGFIEPSQSRKVNRWVAGTSSPDFHSTMWLLRRTGRLVR